MELESRDLLAQRLEELKNIFPEIFDDGVINIDKFKSIVAPQSDEKSEHYSFTWNGKKGCYQTIRQKSNATLKLDTDTTIPDGENVFIEGDNLEVLKLLQTSYHKKIKMITIDPPYNKDKDFVYKDTWGDTITNYLIQTDQLREEGYTSTKTSSTGRRHTNWLNMIYPRLWLSRNLLRDDGVIFVSIDDDEVHNLRKVMDEIYGEESFVAIFPWRKRTAKSDVPFGVSQDYEWIICYAKEKFLAGISHEQKYYYTDDFPNDGWRLSDLTTQRSDDERPNSAFEMIDPKTGKKYPYNPKRTWGVTRDTFQDYYDKGKIVFPDDYDFLNIKTPYYRVFESEDRAKALKKYGTEEAIKAISTHFPKDIGMSESGNKEMVELFGSKLFSFPKPSTLIQYFLEATTSSEDIILDFFAGSGTTAHAVMAQNIEDGGNRKYILVQLPEATDEKSEAYKAGYTKISDITKERIKRVIQKLDYQDGFKSYVLDNSNFQIFKEVKKRPGESVESIEKMLKMSIFHENILTQGAKKIDIVYEIGLKNGFTLSANYEEFKKEKYSFIRLFEENREFFFTFDHKIANDIRECLPQGIKLICYDKSLDDGTKLNLREYFALETL
ncbi:MAG: site-specific DNA-methyltransferase [Sulfuricurvum sp.]|jgi:adenine-specific DNA-methyltransferase|uniref:site-specific DNA-methyltransferase n=1 Tax=Sulfuricurvum sp. TaxID=2025608 RepID=UPI0025F8BE3A|nr:site-specific DNA-methyltransferase [Sulfuricurvum sp.]MCK9371799.1 site-specific DNA-methyltransferase [Sulfuricurvum sp.]